MRRFPKAQGADTGRPNMQIIMQMQSYETKVLLGEKLLFSNEIISRLKPLGKRFAIITDQNMQKLITENWQKFLQKSGLDAFLFSIPPGEAQKTRKTKESLEDQLLTLQLGKDTCIIALGGGVITDLAGFLAATFCRGVPFVSIPTTLLGMVDASIGGKNGVDTPFGKNLIGTTYPASLILMDISTLQTLPEKEWRNGAAEMIKHGLIRSSPLFKKLQIGLIPWQSHDNQFVQECILENCRIKKAIIEADFQELGLRKILNFGHTVGHALELIEGFSLSHGEAIAIGMLCEGYISTKFGHLTKEELSQIEAIFKNYNFPLQISSKVTKDKLIAAMALDKKSEKNIPRFVLLNGIGSVMSFQEQYCTAIDPALLDEAIDWMLKTVSRTT